MDYSSLPNDPDHPVGSSPWQSSPQPTNQSSFPNSETSSSPSSPLAKHTPYTADSSEGIDEGGHEQSVQAEQTIGGQPPYHQADTARVSQPNGKSLDSSNHVQSPPVMQQPTQSQSQQYPRQPQSQQQRGAPNRYHGGANRNAPRQNIPQYKLQAKITGLERTGRKDPVLRFDVHVS